MRIYTYITGDELTNVGLHGLVPEYPKSEVSKVLEKYAVLNHLKLKIDGRTIPLTTKAVYGGVVSSALNLYIKSNVYPDGLYVFAHFNEHWHYPAVAFNYTYRTKLYELLMMKEDAPDMERKKFKTVEQGVDYYVKKYWRSAIPFYKIREFLRDIKYSGSGDRAYNIRKVAEKIEVLIYQKIEPEYLYVKLRHKKYMPFMVWLYNHRGLYVAEIERAKTNFEKELARRRYEEFLERYKRFKERAKKGMGVMYVPKR